MFKKIIRFFNLCNCFYKINILYDSQDNTIEVNGGELTESWHLQNNIGLNPEVSVTHNYELKKIIISSNLYSQINSIKINDVDYEVHYHNGNWYCNFPTMHEFLIDQDVFVIKIKAVKTTR